MSISRILIRLLIILVCAALAAVAGAVTSVWQQAIRSTEKASEFTSMAKISVDLQGINRTPEEQQLSSQYGSILDTLGGDEMHSRALKRVKALNPDLKGAAVKIRVIQNQGIDGITLIATSTEPRYTRLFLDALLDEYIAFRHSVREDFVGKDKDVQKLLSQTLALQKELEESLAALEKARPAATSLIASSDHERLLTRLKTQQNQCVELRLQLKPLAENDPARATLQAQLSAIEAELQDIQAGIRRYEAPNAAFRALTEKTATAKEAYEKNFAQVEKLQASTDRDYVGIMERATPAFENLEDWKAPVALWSLVAGIIGAIAGIVLSVALVRAPRLPIPPQAG